MKKEFVLLLFFMVNLLLGAGCGSGTGSPEGSGSPGISENKTSSERLNGPEGSHPSVFGKKLPPPDAPGVFAVNVARAGSTLPAGTSRVLIMFDEVSVYKKDEGWMSLPLKRDPCQIELLRLPLGTAADLTDPAELPPGKYSHIRIGVKEANILVRHSNHKIVIPNYSLKTENHIEFEMGRGNAIDLVAVWNLGQSIQSSGGFYKLFPTFYAVNRRKAAALQGSIRTETLGLGRGLYYRGEIFVIVYQDRDRNRQASSDEEVLRFPLRKGVDSSIFEIHLLAPGEGYIVIIEANGKRIYEELVEADNLSSGTSYAYKLNGGRPI